MRLNFAADRGRAGLKAHRISVHPLALYGGFAALFATNVLMAIGLFMSPDIASLLKDNDQHLMSAYEDRIATLRVEVDRLHSRQVAQTGDINLQLQELVQQQEVLAEQHQYVRLLAQKAAELGLETADVATDAPAPAALVTGAVAEPEGAEDELGAVAQTVRQMMDESQVALVAIADAATSSTDQIMTELAKVGVKPALPDEALNGMGGPFEPARTDGEMDQIVVNANEVATALARFQAARGALNTIPVQRPVVGDYRLTSRFGNRRDPFRGSTAFHAGIDFAAKSGTAVLSAGAGRVVFAGQMSGYGNVVDIDHGNGIVTRYAHMLAILVKDQQKVAAGQQIGKIGSTGRSTGPHLHFEVRRADTPTDPQRFLTLGRRLQKYLRG